MKISKEWTLEERIKIATAVLGEVQKDIYAGNYSQIGRPNITSVQLILNADAAELETARGSIEELLRGVS